MYCVFKAADKCIKGKDAECIQSSAECNPYAGNMGKQSLLLHQNELPHASKKAEKSHVKKLIASDAVARRTKVIVIRVRHRFRAPFGRGNTQKTPGEVRRLTGDAVQPVRYESVLNKHHLIEPGTSQGSCRSVNREKTLVEMSSSPVFDDRLQCGVCGRKFQFECRLQKHMKIHTGEKPYMCTFVTRNFVQSMSSKCTSFVTKVSYHNVLCAVVDM